MNIDLKGKQILREAFGWFHPKYQHVFPANFGEGLFVGVVTGLIAIDPSLSDEQAIKLAAQFLPHETRKDCITESWRHHVTNTGVVLK